MGLMENKKGDFMILMVNLMFFVMAMILFIGLIPLMNEMLNLAQQSDYLNCPGYLYLGSNTSTLSYNSSLPSNALACFSIRLYLPYIILVVLVAGIAKLLSDKSQNVAPGFGG
jgi:hypothetical protein